MLKAYNTYPAKDPWEDGCVLVFAMTRNDAKKHAYKKGPWVGPDYIEYNAVRVPRMDKYANQSHKTYHVETNEELPEMEEPFFSEHAIQQGA